MNAHFRFILLLMLCVSLTSCGGGSSAPDPDPDPGPDPPVVLNVFPQNLSARTGSTIRFIAELDKQASSYLWDFGGGALPTTATTTTEFQPLVILGDPGTYTATLTVCAADCADPYEFTYTVTSNNNQEPGPHILSVSPTGAVGKRGEDVTFTAQIADGADEWEWFFGEGTTVPTSSLESPTMHLIRPGIFQGALRARLSGGGEDLFEFAYEVLPGVANAPPLILSIGNQNIWACDQKPLVFFADVLSDFPVTYEWRFPGSMTPSITTNSVARVSTIPPEAQQRGELIVRNQFGESAPANIRYNVVDCPELTITEEFYPNRPRGYHFLRLHTTGNLQRIDVSLLNPGNYLEVAEDQLEVFWDQAGTNTIRAQAWRFNDWGATAPAEFAMTTAAAPGPLPLWQRALTIRGNDADAAYPQVAFQQDRPVIIFADTTGNQLRYARALTASPRSDADWSIHSVATLANSDGRLALSMGDGRPVIAAPSHSAPLKFYVADREEPSEAAHWQEIDLVGLVPILWPTEAVGYAPDGRILIAGSPRAGGTVTPLAIQTLVAHPTSTSDINVVAIFPNTPEALQDAASDVVHWRGQWMLHLRAANSAGSGAWLAASEVPIPLSADDWTQVSVAKVTQVNPTYGDGRFMPTSSRLWLAQQFTNYVLDDWGPLEGSYLWSTTADRPLSPDDWEFAGLYPGLKTRYDALSDEVDGRLVVLSVAPGEQQLIHRALLNPTTQGSDWYRMLLQNEIGEAIPIDGRVPITSASHNGRLVIARQNQLFGSGLEVLWADITW